MSEVETDATKALSDTKAVIADLGAGEQKGVVWIKAHTAWLIGLGSFVTGLVVMYLLKH